MNLPDLNSEEMDEDTKSWHDWVGRRVSISGVKVGILRYFGRTLFAEGPWCGVELDEPVGKNNGTVKDVRYFTCKDNFGIFAPLSKIEKIPDGNIQDAVPMALKSKLPHPKGKLKFSPLQSEFHKPPNEITSDTLKSHLPYYQSNANERRTNTVNEMYRKQLHTSDDFSESKLGQSNIRYFNSNNRNIPFIDMIGHLKVAERRINTPIASPCRDHSTERALDFLNQTVTLDGDGRISYAGDTSMGFLPDRCFLNTTFDVFDNEPMDNTNVIGKENTYVLENDNIISSGVVKKTLEGRMDSEEDLMSAEESLGILSPSQMKDFTLSLDYNTTNAIVKSPKIRKIESCDDVNEIPEFEDSRLYSSDLIVDSCSKKSPKDNIISPGVQTLELANECVQRITVCEGRLQGEGLDDNESVIKAEPVGPETPKELNILKDNFKFTDFHHIEEINLNVMPSATSTPSFTTLNLSKLPSVDPVIRRCNLASSDIYSSIEEQIPKLLDRTFDHSPSREFSSTSKLNMSKFLFGIDVIEEKTNQANVYSSRKGDATLLEQCDLNSPNSSIIETICSKLENPKQPKPPISLWFSNDVDEESYCFSENDAIPNVPLNISSIETEQPTLSSATVFSTTFRLKDKERDKVSVSNQDVINSLEETKLCLPSENFDVSVQIPNLVSDEFAELKSDSNCSHESKDNAMCQKLLHHTVDAANFTMGPDTVDKAPNTAPLNSDVVFLPDTTGKERLVSDITVNVQDRPATEHLVNKNKMHNVYSETVKITDLHDNDGSCALNFSKFGETESNENSNDNELVINKNVHMPVRNDHTSYSQCDTMMEKLSETSSCSKLKDDESFKNQTIASDGENIEECISNGVAALKVPNSQVIISTDNMFVTQDDKDHSRKLNLNQTNVLDFTVNDIKDNELTSTFNIDANKMDSSPTGIYNATYSKNELTHLKTTNSKDIPNSVCTNVNNSKQPNIKSLQPKQPKKNVVSKIKLMLESNKSGSALNQENVHSKTTSNQKKVGKWDSVTSRIAASLADNKRKVKKEITSRVNTNLNTSRQTTPKNSQRSSTTKCIQQNENQKNEVATETTVTHNLRNSSNTQTICDGSKSAGPVGETNTDKELRVLTQLQNVHNNKQTKDSKGSLTNFRKKKITSSREVSVFSSSDSLSNCSSQISHGSSKVAISQQKISTPAKTQVGNRGKKINNFTSSTSAENSIKESHVKSLAKNTRTNLQPIASRTMTNRGNSRITDTKPISSGWPLRTAQPKPRPEAPKFVSKTELVKEIQELGVLCESRTKELNKLKIDFRNAAVGFDGLAIVNKYIVEEYDSFSQPHLVEEYRKSLNEQQMTTEKLLVYQKQLESIKKTHSYEINQMKAKLKEVHADDVKQLKSLHSAELIEVDGKQKKMIKTLTDSFLAEMAEHNDDFHDLIKQIEITHKKQKSDLEKNYSERLSEINAHYKKNIEILRDEINYFTEQYELQQRQLKEMEAAFMKDKNAKIQNISVKKTELENEVQSLRAVLEIKSSEIHDLNSENIKMKQELEKLFSAKEKIKKLEITTEDLKEKMEQKVHAQRVLDLRFQQLANDCENESKANRRLSMANEQLVWRLQQNVESPMQTSSFSDTTSDWCLKGKRMDSCRSNSRISLPFLSSDSFQSSDNFTKVPMKSKNETNNRCSLSVSWHPALQPHSETIPLKGIAISQKHSESQFEKKSQLYCQASSELNIDQFMQNSSRMYQHSSSMMNETLFSHPMSMSWGGESFTDYYESLDDRYFKDNEDEMSKSLKRKNRNSEEISFKDMPGEFLLQTTSNLKCEIDQDLDKSMSGISLSLQSSYNSDQGYEDSSCGQGSKSSDLKEDRSNPMVYEDLDPFGIHRPRNLAGEAMVQDLGSVARNPNKILYNKEQNSQIDDISSSPEEGKDKLANQISMTTPSIDTLSSQGMADSTNLDISWGDEEVLSEDA